MAKVKIQGHASGTGIFTVTAPDSDVNRTITLPDGTGTLAFTTGDDDKLPLAGGTMTGNLVMGSNLVDGIDISARDAILTSTTTTAAAALPKAGGTMTGALTGTTATFSTADNTDTLTLISTDADANVGPNLALWRNSANPADNDLIGTISFDYEDSGGNQTTAVNMHAKVIDVTDTTEDGWFELDVMTNGTANSYINCYPGEFSINDDGIDLDFRVESDTKTHAFFVQGSDGKVGVNNDGPTGNLTITGASGSSETSMLNFDDYGTYGTGTAQRIDFRMGRSPQVNDTPVSIVAICEGSGTSTAAHSNGLEFRTVTGNSQETLFKILAGSKRFLFNTTEAPHSNNPQTNNCIVMGPSTSAAITQGLTSATVLINRGGELYATDSSHNNTQLTPHNWNLISAGPSEELAWTYWSQRPDPEDNERLQSINVDIAQVVRKVEDLVGEKLIYTENSDMDGHSHQNIISDLIARIEALENA